MWYTSKTASETSLAHQKEILQHRGQNFECNAEYMKEIKQFPDCIPKKCGRYVLDKLVTANEADILLRIAKRGNNVCYVNLSINKSVISRYQFGWIIRRCFYVRFAFRCTFIWRKIH